MPVRPVRTLRGWRAPCGGSAPLTFPPAPGPSPRASSQPCSGRPASRGRGSIARGRCVGCCAFPAQPCWGCAPGASIRRCAAPIRAGWRPFWWAVITGLRMRRWSIGWGGTSNMSGSASEEAPAPFFLFFYSETLVHGVAHPGFVTRAPGTPRRRTATSRRGIPRSMADRAR